MNKQMTSAEIERFTDVCCSLALANRRSAMFTGLEKFDTLLGPDERLSAGLVEVDRQPSASTKRALMAMGFPFRPSAVS